MAFEERLELLLRKAREDYRSMLLNSNLYDNDEQIKEDVSEKIVVSKALLTYMETSLEDSHTDVEALLFHDRPLTAFYEDFTESGAPLWGGLLEPLDSFITSTKHHIRDVLEQWDNISTNEVAKAEDFRAMERQIGRYDSEQEQSDELER